MTLAWVLGSTGLLGSALCRELARQGTTLFSPVNRLLWRQEDELVSQLAAAKHAFSKRLGTDERWEVYWAAGVGTMSSLAGDLALETRALAELLRLIESDPLLMNRPGSVAFASSAGAIYAGSGGGMITEETVSAPTTAYAKEKLLQEELVTSFALKTRQTAALLARFSTIYGAGQSIGKQQGLLTHIARCTVRNKPIQIYVPFDTIRDYIAADDAAAAMVAGLRSMTKRPCVLTKIVASEHPTTIAEVISVFKRITRRAPKVITSANRLSALYSRRVQFESVVLPKFEPASKTSLLIGISQVMAAERAAFARSSV